MKKLFSLALVFFAMLFAANAQVTVILEAHDVWSDGSGYQLLLDADHNTYGTTIPTSGGLTSSGDATSAVYAEFEYKVPVNADGSMTTQNIVYDGSVTITIPAGTYDYCITNPTPNDRIWIASDNGSQPGRADDFVFEDGKTYHFLIGRVGNNDGVTLTVTLNPTSPTIDAPAAVNFGNVLLNNSSTLTANIGAYLLTSSVSAITTAPFEISADGNTFGTTATIPQAGGTLYIKYTPTAVGLDNGTVILSSTGADNDTIVLTGSGLDCSNIVIPFTEGFESTIDCWTMVSMDPANDGSFGVFADAEAYEGNNDFVFSSYSSASDYNQWLITPELTLNAGETYTVKFYYKGYRASDNFRVMYSTTNNQPTSFTMLQDFTSVATTWTQAALVLPAGTKYVAINYYGNYAYYLFVDNFSIEALSAPDVTVSGPTRLMAGATGTFIATSPLATTFAWEVDGIAATSTTDTLTYIFSTPGIHNVKAIASNNFGSGADSMDVDIFTCDAITTFPFTESFDATSTTVECWEIVDANNDENTFEIDNGEVVYSYSSTEAANDYLISPELTLPSGMYGHIDYMVGGASYPEKLSVYVIPANGTIANAVNIVPTMTVTNDEDIATLPFDLSAYANQTIRVAFKAESDADMYELILSNFMVEALPASATITVDPTSMDFITEVGNTTREQAATVTAYVLTNDITVSTAAPFEVSLDGTTYGATATIPAGNIITATLYVRYAPTTPGTQTGTVTLTSGTATATISLTGEGVDCSAGIASLPFTHDFNDAAIPPFCWGYESEESFLRLNVDEETGDYGVAIGQVDYLMTPEIHTTTSMNFSFDYATYGGSASSSTFRVGYASTNNINNFTWLTPVTVTEDIEGFERYSANIPSGAKYIAIQATEIGEFQYWFWMYPNYVLLDNITIAEGDGIEDITSEDNVSIYPNPANNVINVNAASNINTVEVFNMMGQKVAAFDANDTHVQINTTALSNGMYMMRITTENGVSNQKFTVAR